MNLSNAELGREYLVGSVALEDDELSRFLFSLGCYSGEPITVISRKRRNCTVAIKNGRYNMDNRLAAAISVE